MTATILIDNQTRSSLAAEWGLAVWIEYKGHVLLLDTGETGAFIENADKMRLDVARVEFGVLSHAHHDHANGMPAFFKRNQTASFYLRKGCEENCYAEEGVSSRYIGIQKGCLERYKDRIRFVEGPYELLPGAVLLPHTTPGLERLGEKARLYVEQNGKRCPDGFLHEQSLVLQTGYGLVIWNSCSHGGADNIIKEVADAYPGQTIYALVGGLHLYASSEKEVRALAARIRETGIQKVYTGHCTGESAFSVLKQELGDKVEPIYSGMKITIPDA
ncbi:MAG: MBL fold metallo-hydrolase [Oscillospiraceae bacterium]